MTAMKFVFCAFVSICAMAACAAPDSPSEIEDSLRTVTVTAIPGVDAQAIQVLNSVRQPSKWTWNARIGEQVYECDADDKLRLPSCQAVT